MLRPVGEESGFPAKAAKGSPGWRLSLPREVSAGEDGACRGLAGAGGRSSAPAAGKELGLNPATRLRDVAAHVRDPAETSNLPDVVYSADRGFSPLHRYSDSRKTSVQETLVPGRHGTMPWHRGAGGARQCCQCSPSPSPRPGSRMCSRWTPLWCPRWSLLPCKGRAPRAGPATLPAASSPAGSPAPGHDHPSPPAPQEHL